MGRFYKFLTTSESHVHSGFDVTTNTKIIREEHDILELQAEFGGVVFKGKLLVVVGYSMINEIASDEVYQYDFCLKNWNRLSKMNVAPYDFACVEVNGLVYAVGGYGVDNNILVSVEVYDPDNDKWTLIESLYHPRYTCFDC
ncbi:unnamed protein product [Lupinus luteus]|uniref:Uncharacterized protein n=1 Tax=Lupinus luteus TaxID=3873 RepID=A0AAV1WAH6_LUPLU